jgi:signal transduction histidine kinase/CheY-like chemotaxis protein
MDSSSQRLRRRIVAAGVVLVAALAGAVGYDSWRLHQEVVFAAERELGNLAKALAGQGVRNLQAVDLLLRESADWYESAGSGLTPDAVAAALAARAASVPQVSVLSLVDAQGRQRFRSRDTGRPLADVADRPYFLQLREHDAGRMYIGDPLLTRTEGLPSLVVARRLSRPDGSFDGVVTAIVTLQQLRAAYSEISLGSGSSLLLLLDDGTLVVRQPEATAADRERRYADLVAAKSPPLIDRLPSPFDGSTQLVAAVGVGQEPLTLVLMRSRSDALRPWRDELRSALQRLLLFALLVAVTVASLLRQLRRLDASAERQAALQARLASAARLESLGTLAGGIAHDFNNILGAILGFGEMAQQRAPAGSDMRRHLDRIMEGGARARALVRRILDFSRGGGIERVPVHLQAVVEEVLALLRPGLAATVRLDAQLAAAGAAVLGDSTQLHQVAMNLCSNAIHAVGAAGVVSVQLDRLRSEAPRALLDGELEVGPYLRLTVTDSGHGMPPEVLQRVFEPFFTTKKQGEGTGLGLAMVHGIVAGLGGAIDIASEPGRGTRIAVWLPCSGDIEAVELAVPDVAAAEAAGGHEWPQGQGQVVMVVDDERPLVELAEELLAALGYEPVGFDSSAGALAAFEREPARFDALLTDQMLPGLSGSDMAARMLALRPGLPVILTSGKLDAAVEQHALALGVAAVLRKPLGARELAHALVAALGR